MRTGILVAFMGLCVYPEYASAAHSSARLPIPASTRFSSAVGLRFIRVPEAGRRHGKLRPRQVAVCSTAAARIFLISVQAGIARHSGR